MLRATRPAGRWIVALLVVWAAAGVWQTHKPMPAGTDIGTAPIAIAEPDLDFLYDLTYVNGRGARVREQHIFDAAFAMIDAARTFIVLDFFLVNDGMGASAAAVRPLSRQLADRLQARKRAIPNLQVLVITDPINEVYGGQTSALFDELRHAGIDVVNTDLRRLRDSNPAYSVLWRAFVQWWGNAPDGGWLPNPFVRGDQVGLRSWLAMLNFKANHRKVLIADDGRGGGAGLVTSANPHDASSAHSNVAVRLSGPILTAMLQSELDIARFSGWSGDIAPAFSKQSASASATGDTRISYLTEAAIRSGLVDALDTAGAGDRIDVAMFYLSERRVIESLMEAAGRGARIRLLLDPNKDAFGLEKDGVPNRPVANELVEKGAGAIEVRWYRTSGEQFHSKLAMIAHAGRLTVSLGSANLTRRNIDGYNLESNVQLDLAEDGALAQRISAWFERIWNGDDYSAPFAAYRDDSSLRYWRYRLMEASGLSTF